jgi:putative transposase
MILAHKIRLHPNKEAATYFAKASGIARLAYNWGLAEWKRQYEAGGKPSAYSVNKAFNAIKRSEYPFVLEVTKYAPAQAFRDLDKAFANFFRGLKKGQDVGFPRFKSKKRSRQTFYVGNDHFVVNGKYIRIPKLGWVKMAEELRLDGKIMNCRIGRTGNNWYASIQVEIDHENTGPGLVQLG